jgi:cell division protein FtsL
MKNQKKKKKQFTKTLKDVISSIIRKFSEIEKVQTFSVFVIIFRIFVALFIGLC